MRTCFLIGRRDAPQTLRAPLTEAVERYIAELDTTEFVVGQYGDFDRMAAAVVKEAKERHPEVTLTLLLPYHPFDRPIDTPPGFDGTFYPAGMEHVPKRAAIKRANEYMLRHCDYVLGYANAPGNSRDLMEKAMHMVQKGTLCYAENLAVDMSFE